MIASFFSICTLALALWPPIGQYRTAPAFASRDAGFAATGQAVSAQQQSAPIEQAPNAGFFFQDRALQATQAISDPTALLVFGLALMVIGGGLRRKGFGESATRKTVPQPQPSPYPGVQLADVGSAMPPLPH